MPYTLLPNKFHAKNPDGTGFLPQNAVASQDAQDMMAELDQYVADAQDVLEGIQTEIASMQGIVNGIEDERQQMIDSIASIAGQATDTTLTQSGAAADAATAGEQIRNLQSSAYANETLLCDTGNQLLVRGNFQRGLYNPSQGSIVAGNQNRISSRNEMVFPYDITLTIDPNFSVYPWLYRNGAWVNQLEKTGSFFIAQNDPFYLYIRRKTEIPNEKADVPEFLSAVTVASELGRKISSVTTGYYYVDEYRKSSDSNDTNAIQNAINAAGDHGTIVFRSNKTYTISSTIVVNYENVKLLSFASGMHVPTIQAAPNMSGWMFSVKKSGFSMCNLTIAGNDNHTTHGLELKIPSEGATSDSVANIDAYVHECYFRNHLNGISAYGRNAKIVNTHFSGCRNGVVFNEVIYTEDGRQKFAMIRGMIVRDCRFHGMGQFWYSAPMAPFTSIDDVGGSNGHNSWCVKNLADHARQCDVDITGNIVDGANFAGLYKGQPDGVNILRNNIAGDSYCSILAYVYNGANGGMERGIIKDNTVSSQRSDKFSGDEFSASIGNASPIYVNGASVAIQNNSIFDFGSAGVYIKNGKRVIVEGNLFDGVCYDTNIGAVYSVGTSNLDLAVSHNTFTRYPDRQGEVNLVSDTNGVDTDLSKYNCVRNITDNLSQV